MYVYQQICYRNVLKNNIKEIEKISNNSIKYKYKAYKNDNKIIEDMGEKNEKN